MKILKTVLTGLVFLGAGTAGAASSAIGIVDFQTFKKLSPAKQELYVDGLREVTDEMNLYFRKHVDFKSARVPASTNDQYCINDGGMLRSLNSNHQCEAVTCPGTDTGLGLQECDPILYPGSNPRQGKIACISSGTLTKNSSCADLSNAEAAVKKLTASPKLWSKLQNQYDPLCEGENKKKPACQRMQYLTNRINNATGTSTSRALPAAVATPVVARAAAPTKTANLSVPVETVTVTANKTPAIPAAIPRATRSQSNDNEESISPPVPTPRPDPGASPSDKEKTSASKAATSNTDCGRAALAGTCNASCLIETFKCSGQTDSKGDPLVKGAMDFQDAYRIFCQNRSITSSEESQIRAQVASIRNNCIAPPKMKSHIDQVAAKTDLDYFSHDISSDIDTCIAAAKSGGLKSATTKATMTKNGEMVTVAPVGDSSFPATVTHVDWAGMGLRTYNIDLCEARLIGFDGIGTSNSANNSAADPAAASAGGGTGTDGNH